MTKETSYKKENRSKDTLLKEAQTMFLSFQKLEHTDCCEVKGMKRNYRQEDHGKLCSARELEWRISNRLHDPIRSREVIGR